MSEPDQMERTLVIIKPDAIQRRLAGEIIHRFERRRPSRLSLSNPIQQAGKKADT